MYKDVKFGNELRTKIIKGVNTVAEAVTATMGPRGTNVIFTQDGFSYPNVTKDGVTVAQSIILEDKFENLGVMISREAAEATNNRAGDGTTGTIAILQEIVNEGIKRTETGLNPIIIKRGIDEAKKDVLENLEQIKKEVSTYEEKVNIATISANNDRELGKLIVDVIEEVGKNGVVTVTSGSSGKNEVEYISGIKFTSTYEDQIFINNQKRLSCVMENPLIVISSDKITSQNQLIPVIQKLLDNNKKEMVIMAESIEGQALAFLIQNHLNAKFTCIPVKIPSITGYGEDSAIDIATLVGASIVGEGRKRKLTDIEFEDFGSAESIIVGREYSVISNGKGNEEEIKERVDNITSLLEEEADSFKKEKLKDRLGRINGKIANIKVGGTSSVEQTEIKYRIEDSLNATKHAIEEGIVEGAGTALLRISQKISTTSEVPEIKVGYEIVKKAICAPFKKIISNGGGNADAIMGKVVEMEEGYNSLTNTYSNLFEDGVIDPKRVIACEVENACSTASTLLTSTVGIVDKEDAK